MESTGLLDSVNSTLDRVSRSTLWGTLSEIVTMLFPGSHKEDSVFKNNDLGTIKNYEEGGRCWICEAIGSPEYKDIINGAAIEDVIRHARHVVEGIYLIPKEKIHRMRKFEEENL